MKIIEFNDKDILSESVAKHILDFFKPGSRVNIALFSGSSSIPIYELLVNELNANPIYENIHFYIHNEIPLLPEGKGGLVINHINECFFSKMNINKENIHFLNDDNYQLLEKQISDFGGIDLMLLSVGDDGHIAANYPGADIFTGIRKINLSKHDDLYRALLENEKSDHLVTPHFYTFWIGSILQAKNISVVAYGESKRDVLDKVKNDVVDTMYPVTLLKTHKSCELYTLKY